MSFPQMSQLYKIDGKPIPEPSAAPVDINDAHSPDSGRTLGEARMIIKVVRFGLRSVHLKFDLLSDAQMKDLYSRFHKPYYNLTYKDPEYGINTIECYVPERKTDLYSATLYNGMWRDITFDCIEV